MSGDLDLTEAVDAAMRGFCADLVPPVEPDDPLSAIQRHAIREQALSYVMHAAPIIAAQVREQVAGAVERPPEAHCEGEHADSGHAYRCGARTRTRQIARFIRGGAA